MNYIFSVCVYKVSSLELNSKITDLKFYKNHCLLILRQIHSGQILWCIKQSRRGNKIIQTV